MRTSAVVGIEALVSDLVSGTLRYNNSVVELSHGLKLNEEARSVTGIFCNQYVSADEENKNIVENLICEYC
ncbi:hypothetical protein Lal_00035080 [Lupinus albus]|nr:hypothetical protein Lal_00035080 [Lupinus albus]